MLFLLVMMVVLSSYSCTQQADRYDSRDGVQTTSRSSEQVSRTAPDGNDEGNPPSESTVEELEADEDEVEISDAPKLEEGSLVVSWIHGSADCNQDQNPPIQVHAYNPRLYILRQNKCTNFEAPFMYLLLGEQKALLLDSGATRSAAQFPIRTEVEAILSSYYGDQRLAIELVVAHSHAHGDHIAGDSQFQGQAMTTVVGTSQAEVATFFQINDWPNQVVNYDLGNRVLKVFPIPGHQDAHIAIYDARTQILLTGDSLYPGRLYIDDWETYRSSIKRLRDAITSEPIQYVLGAHIEMSQSPGVDYPIGTQFQPEEHLLQLPLQSLQLLNTELQSIGPTPMRKVTDDFIISP